MKIQLDFTNKTITIIEMVNFYDLTKKIKSIVPDWKDWRLMNNGSTIYWSNPINWDWHYPYIPATYATGGTITKTTGDSITIDMSKQPDQDHVNIYNLEVN